MVSETSNSRPRKNGDAKKKVQNFSALQSSSANNKSSSSDDNDDDDVEQTCLICAEKIKIAALSPCNHKVCHMCAFRNIALYKKNQCLICRSEVNHFIFTENLSLEKFDEIDDSQLVAQSKGDHGVRFTSEYARDETLELLEYTCPIKSCTFHRRKMKNFKELKDHVREVHDKYYCEICAKNKKAFISELKLYNRKELHRHQSSGDSAGFKGHPVCKFCPNKRFYSDDELYIHMRDNHEKCHICEKIDPAHPQWFRDYGHLFEHFKSGHYICNVPTCLEKKFIVFEDEFELQTHMAKEHPDLVGNNILLSTSRFNNQLTTVSNNKKKKNKISANDNSNHDSYEMKKKRLEERARHYLNYSQPAFDKFLVANIEYSDGSLTAQQIVDKYHEIFKNSKDVDYDLLIYELAGLFPSKSSLRKELEVINKPKLEMREFKEQFPVLPGTESTMQSSFWGGNNKPKSSTKLTLSKASGNNANSFPTLPTHNDNLFPALPGTSTSSWTTNKSKPNAVSSSKSSLNIKTRGMSLNPTPVNAYSIPGYNPLPAKGKSKAKNPWNSTKNVSAINPNVSSTSSFPPLPSINTSKPTVGSSSSTSSLSTSLAKSSLQPTIIRQSSGKKLDNSMFPSLPSAPPKKIIPRVNPVNNSSTVWGASTTSTTSSNEPSNGDLDIIGTTVKSGKGKKGKKVVYRIGI